MTQGPVTDAASSTEDAVDYALSMPVKISGNWGWFVISAGGSRPMFRWPTKKEAMPQREKEAERLRTLGFTVRLLDD